MQVSRPVVMYIPELFSKKLREYLVLNPPTFSFKLDNFYYLTYYLIVSSEWNRDSNKTQLNINRLRVLISYNIDVYISYLREGEFYIKTSGYSVGTQSSSYKINEKLLVGVLVVRIDNQSKLLKRIISNQTDRSHNNRRPDYLKAMYKKFMLLDMDYEGARCWIENNVKEGGVKKYILLNSLIRMKDQRFRYFKRNGTNQRLDTNITNMKSELRQFLKGDLVSIDLKNSQPFLLSLFMKELVGFMKDFREDNETYTGRGTLCCRFCGIDVVKYFGCKVVRLVLKTRQIDENTLLGEVLNLLDQCVEGRFYECFLESLDGIMISRDDVKKMMFAVLFSRNFIRKWTKIFVPYSEQKGWFAKLFPLVITCLEVLKKDDHTKLPILLQRVESKIFIDKICPLLVSENIIPLTIHDSVIVDVEHKDKSLGICLRVFKDEFGVEPTFHTELL